MSTGLAVFFALLFLGGLGLLNLIAGVIFGDSGNNSNNSNSGSGAKDKDAIRSQAPDKIKCRCMECGQVVMIPKQYLGDLSYYGPQTAKCPNCDWKMRKVKIIQTWGLH